jgi:hypothetical protein
MTQLYLMKHYATLSSLVKILLNLTLEGSEL